MDLPIRMEILQQRVRLFLHIPHRTLNRTLRKCLVAADYDVEILDMATASTLLPSVPHAIILIEAQTADSPSFALCQQLRAQGITTPIYMFTSHDESLIQGAKDCGVTDTLPLPLQPLRLVKQIEQAFSQQASHSVDVRYETLLNKFPSGMIIISAQGTIRHWNDAAEQMYGWKASEVLGHPLPEILPLHNMPFTFDSLSDFIGETGIWRGDVTQQSKTQRSLNISLTIATVRDEQGQLIEYIMLHRDTTAQKHLEVTLQASEEQTRSILDAMTEIVMILDRRGRFIQIPTPNSPLLPRPASEMVGHTLDELLPDRTSEIQTTLNTVIQEQRPVHIDFDIKIKNETRRYNAVFSPFHGDQIMMVAHDVTSHWQAEHALQETATRYRQLFEYANDAIMLVDVETNHILDANRQSCRSLGYQREELLLLTLDDLDVTTSMGDSERPFLSMSGRMITEHSYKHRDGHHVIVESSTRVITVNGRPALLTFSRDISERQRARAAEREQRLLAEALRDTASALNSTLQLGEVMERILNNISRIVQMESASVMLIENGVVRIVGSRGYPPSLLVGLEARRYNLDEIPTLRWMLDHKQTLLIADTTRHPLWTPDDKLSTIQSYLGAPIMSGDAVIGFLNVDSSRQGHFKSQHVEGITAFADQAGVALRNADLYEKSQRYAEELETKVAERTKMLVRINAELTEQITERQSIEKALQEERNLLRTLIDNLPDHVYVKDAESRFILANIALTRFLHAESSDALRGQRDADFYPAEQAAVFAQQERQIMSTMQPQTADEILVVTQHGEKVWLLISKVPLMDARGQVIGIVGIDRDITPTKIAEQKLSEERNLLRTLIDTIPDRIYLKDSHLRLVLSNLANAWAFGYRLSDDILGKTDQDFMVLTAAQDNITLEQRILQTGQPIINHPVSFIAPDGAPTWELATRLPLYNADGEVTGLIGVNRDITRLRQTEAQLEQVIASAQCLLWSAIVEQRSDEYVWQLRIANEEAAQRFLPLDIQDQSYTDAWQNAIVAEDNERRQYVLRTHLRYNRLTYSQQIQCRQADGTIRWLVEDVQIRHITPGRWSMVGVCTDITEHKKAEHTLQRAKEELEHRVSERTEELVLANQMMRQEIQDRKRAEDAERTQRLVAEALRDSIAAINNSLDRNEVLDHILTAMETVVPHTAAAILLHEGDYARIVRHRGYKTELQEMLLIKDMPDFQSVLATRRPHIMGDSRPITEALTPTGTEWIRDSITIPIQLENEVIGFITLESPTPNQFTEEDARLLHSFSEQASIAIRNARLMEEVRGYASDLEVLVEKRTLELRNDRAQLTSILDSMREGVIFYDLQYHASYVNRSLTEITGYTEDDWRMGGVGSNMMMNLAQPEPYLMVRKIGRSLRRKGSWQGNLELKRKDGSVYSAAISTTDVKTAEQRLGVLVVVRDISQEKALEEQKKRFIADAAHELRTPIANLKVRLFLISRQPNRLREHLDIAMKAADWMQTLIDNLFDMARFERGVIELKREPLILQEFLRDVVRFQEPEAERRGLEFIYEFPDEAIHLQIDPFRVAQVVTNLVVNALNHTQQGSITVKTWIDDKDILIRVRDTGSGIGPEHLPHLFEPFYRARNDDNRGTGLGLSISQEIVGLHGGTITIDSTVGEGSAFTICLPLVTS